MPLQHHAPVLQQSQLQINWLLAPEHQEGVEDGLERAWEPALELKTRRGKPRYDGGKEGGVCKGFGARTPPLVPVPRRAGQGTHPGAGGRWEPARAGKAPFCSCKRGVLHHSPNLSPCPVAMGLPVLFLAPVPLPPGSLVASPGPPPCTRWSHFPKLPLQTPFTPLGSNQSCTARNVGLCM